MVKFEPTTPTMAQHNGATEWLNVMLGYVALASCDRLAGRGLEHKLKSAFL